MDRAYTSHSNRLDDLDSLLNSSSSSFIPNGFFPFDHVTGLRRPLLYVFCFFSNALILINTHEPLYTAKILFLDQKIQRSFYAIIILKP